MRRLSRSLAAFVAAFAATTALAGGMAAATVSPQAQPLTAAFNPQADLPGAASMIVTGECGSCW